MTPANSRAALALFLMMLNLVIGLGLFFTSQATQQTNLRLQKLDAQIMAESQSVRLLDAEWAYLTRPQHLADLMAARDTLTPATQGVKLNTAPVNVAVATPAADLAAITPAAGISEQEKAAPKIADEPETKNESEPVKIATQPVTHKPAVKTAETTVKSKPIVQKQTEGKKVATKQTPVKMAAAAKPVVKAKPATIAKAATKPTQTGQHNAFDAPFKPKTLYRTAQISRTNTTKNRIGMQPIIE